MVPSPSVIRRGVTISRVAVTLLWALVIPQVGYTRWRHWALAHHIALLTTLPLASPEPLLRTTTPPSFPLAYSLPWSCFSSKKLQHGSVYFEPCKFGRRD